MKESAARFACAWDGSPRVTLRTVSASESSRAHPSVGGLWAPCPEVDPEADGRSQPQSRGAQVHLPQEPQEGRRGGRRVWRCLEKHWSSHRSGGGGGWLRQEEKEMEYHLFPGGTTPWAPLSHTVCYGWALLMPVAGRPPHHLIQAPPQTLLQWPQPAF